MGGLKHPELYRMSQQEVALALGVSQQAVNDVERRAIRKFREAWVRLFGEFDPSIFFDEGVEHPISPDLRGLGRGGECA